MWATLTAVGNSTDRASARLPGMALLVNSGWSASAVWACARVLSIASAQAPTVRVRREEMGCLGIASSLKRESGLVEGQRALGADSADRQSIHRADGHGA